MFLTYVILTLEYSFNISKLRLKLKKISDDFII